MAADDDLISAMDELSRSEKKVRLHDRLYSPVALRVEMLRKHFGLGVSVLTEIVSSDEALIIIKASVVKAGEVIATGYAEEARGAKGINARSALENAETSAIGRALANLGLVGGEYASADELTGAVSAENAVITEEQASEIEGLLEQSGRNRDQFLRWLKVPAVRHIPAVRYETIKKTLQLAIERRQS